ncbi:hypothetical protein [Streptosporangium sp. NPDC000396]|uniref:hypothetical protein n=1 Tax=Streptosporangium sp. NPDC000396 TaxID=3366185 RepID=UPI003674DB80
MNAVSCWEPRGFLAELFDRPHWPAPRSREWNPIRFEDYAKDDRYVLRAELPGLDPGKDVEINLASGVPGEA